MTQPIRIGTKAYNMAAAASVISSNSDPINFGTSAGRYCVVTVISIGASSGVNLTSVTIGGVPMTGGTDRDMAGDIGAAGRHRSFVLQGDTLPSGVQEVLCTASANTARLVMIVEWGHSSPAVSAPVFVATSSATPSFTVSGAGVDDVCSALMWSDAASLAGGNPWSSPLVTIAAAPGTTLGVALAPVVGCYHAYGLHKTGVGSVVLGAATTGHNFTPVHWGWIYRVSGIASAGVAPSIGTQPASQSVTAGSAATFSVTATGSALTYQWQRNPGGNTSFANISGATAASYTTPTAAISGGSANSGDTYRVVITGDTSPAATSLPATLTVTEAAVAPAIVTQPANATRNAGETATFSVVVTGTAPISYQWRRNGNNIGGATSSTYTTPATSVSGGTANNGDVFLCYVSNNAGNVTSAGATLVVNSSAPTAPSGSVIGGPFWNNTLGERWRNQAVTWTWWGGSTQRIGNLTAPPVHGTGTISADGYLTPGVNGEGVLLVSIQRTDATDDDAFYQGF